MSDNFKCEHGIHWTDCFACNPTEEESKDSMNTPNPKQVTQALSDEKKAEAFSKQDYAYTQDRIEEIVEAARKESYLAGLRESRAESIDTINKLKELVDEVVRLSEGYMLLACQPDNGQLFSEFDDELLKIKQDYAVMKEDAE